MGKADDGLELPFPVLDDGDGERAAAFGVIAGVRAAPTTTCVVLPVDAPLVTPELLRALAEPARPTHGPAPGRVREEMLSELEPRVAWGELSCEA